MKTSLNSSRQNDKKDSKVTVKDSAVHTNTSTIDFGSKYNSHDRISFSSNFLGFF